jgi:hypothetical protein
MSDNNITTSFFRTNFRNSPNVWKNSLSRCVLIFTFTIKTRLTAIFIEVSGANRGIGYALAAAIAARSNTIVFAGARDPAAQSLKDLAAKHPNVHPVKLTSGDEADNAAAAAEIQKTAGHIDVIIANAGIYTSPSWFRMSCSISLFLQASPNTTARSPRRPSPSSGITGR